MIFTVWQSFSKPGVWPIKHSPRATLPHGIEVSFPPSSQLLSAYSLPSTHLINLLALFHLILIRTLRDKYSIMTFFQMHTYRLRELNNLTEVTWFLRFSTRIFIPVWLTVSAVCKCYDACSVWPMVAKRLCFVQVHFENFHCVRTGRSTAQFHHSTDTFIKGHLFANRYVRSRGTKIDQQRKKNAVLMETI